MQFNNFTEFWPFYLSQHTKPRTRFWHFIGTTTVFAWLISAIVYQNAWLVLGAPVTAYALAWYSHFFVEGNKPATFGHPFWSLRADFKMYGLMLIGRLDRELEKLEK